MDNQRDWVVLINDPEGLLRGKPSEPATEDLKLVNLNLVRFIDQVSTTHLRLHFANDHTMELHGSGAGELLLTLMRRGMLPNGIPFPAQQDTPSQSQQ